LSTVPLYRWLVCILFTENRFDHPAATPGQEFVGVVVGQGEAHEIEDLIVPSRIQPARDCRL
jgi:threonine dehydrogenase-like Zn-dependent dehydrogenase